MNQRKALLLLFAAVLVVVGATTCQGKALLVYGVVVDWADGPIRDADLDLQCTSRGEKTLTKAKTERDGHFKLDVVLSGVCSLMIAAPGFAARNVRLSSSDNRAEKDLGKIRLKLSCTAPGALCDNMGLKDATQKGRP
jgi:hypothetical protein